MTAYIDPDDLAPVELEPLGGIADQVHLFQRREILAVNAAIAAKRPLLVRGEPGTGKTQLARAAAKRLGRAFLSFVVDSQTEARDLQWELDSLGRLAEAQLAGATRAEDPDVVRSRLAVAKFVRPGPLWWAFHWDDAASQAERSNTPSPYLPDSGDPKRGCVVLVDEIDKAESEVPNGLLEAMGSGQFRPAGRDIPVHAQAPLPLLVITTNQERVLPDPFLRRCLVLDLKLPSDEAGLTDLLCRRGAAHFGSAASEKILMQAAALLWRDRSAATAAGQTPLPGQAEYLDLLRAVLSQYPDDESRQRSALDEIAEFVLSNKHAD
jgi:MoxR-like ATPase